MIRLMTNHDFSGIGAFTIFSGEVAQTDDIKYFEFDTGVYSFPRRVESSDNFALKNLFFTDEILALKLEFHTSFGLHEEEFLVSGVTGAGASL